MSQIHLRITPHHSLPYRPIYAEGRIIQVFKAPVPTLETNIYYFTFFNPDFLSIVSHHHGRHTDSGYRSICTHRTHPGTLSLSESETAKICDGENEKKLQRQVNQASSLLKKLPFDIHYLIFENLGPASRRILGAACSSFYDIYKSHFYNKQIAVHYNEASAAEQGLPGTRRFYNILPNWLIPREGIVTKEEAEQTRMMQSYWPFMNLPTKQKRDKSYWLGWILDQHKDEGHGMWLLYRKRKAKMKISAPIHIPYGGKAVLELDGRPILPMKKRAKKSTRAF